MRKDIRHDTLEKKIDILSSIIFFPAIKRKWPSYFLERFHSTVLFPMILPKVVLGFGRLVGFIAHSTEALLHIQSLLISSMKGSEWKSVDNKEWVSIINLNDDVKMVRA
jgi:hypothetical protein